MAENVEVYHGVDSLLSSRERADRVISLCVAGSVASARTLLVDGEDPDLMLARGVLYYWLARTSREMNYETAKDILSAASRLFLVQTKTERSLLADVWIGLCYWRQGQSAEATLILNRVIAEATDPQTRYLALLNKSVPQTDAKAWREALDTLATLEPLVAGQADLSLRGLFFHQRGMAYRQAYEEINSDVIQNALRDYEQASECYELAGNVRFEAAILNNLAVLYCSLNDHNRAHVNVDRAISLYSRLGDRSNLAHARDTKAGILFSEGHYSRAKKYSDQAVLLASHEDELSLLPGFLLTRGRILVKMGLPNKAFRDLREAVKIAESTGNLAAAANIYLVTIEELSSHLSAETLLETYRRAHQVCSNRWSACALTLLDRIAPSKPSSLPELKAGVQHQQEAELIREALERCSGSVTRAAALLGKTHGGLAHIIKTRHRELTPNRKPIIRRRKKILSVIDN